jgi:hypothetical protein
MAVALRQVLLLTGSVGTATLAQAVLGCLGVYHVARAGLRLAFPGLLSPGREAAAAVGVLAVLLFPLSPLAYYLVYVQNDGWLLVALLWAVAGWANLGLGRPSGLEDSTRPTRPLRCFWWLAAVLGSAAVVLVRHNAVVLVPVFAALAVVSAAHRGKLAALAAAALVAGLPFAAEKCLAHRYPVARLHPEDQILALDLVGVCVEREELRPHLPYTSAHLIDGKFRERYIPGFVNLMYLYSPAGARPTDVNYVGEVRDGVQAYGSRHAELAADYRRALRHAPGTLAAVKAKAFLGYLLNDHPGEHWHPDGIVGNALGLRPSPRFAPVRSALRAADGAVNGSPGLRFLCTNHLPWFVANLLGVGVAGYLVRHGAGRRWRVGLLLLVVPTAYFASYLPAVAAPYYRYMYPATLLVQVGVLTLGAGAAVHGLRKLRAAAAGLTREALMCSGPTRT